MISVVGNIFSATTVGTSMKVLKTLRTELPYNTATPFLGLYSMDSKSIYY